MAEVTIFVAAFECAAGCCTLLLLLMPCAELELAATSLPSTEDDNCCVVARLAESFSETGPSPALELDTTWPLAAELPAELTVESFEKMGDVTEAGDGGLSSRMHSYCLLRSRLWPMVELSWMRQM